MESTQSHLIKTVPQINLFCTITELSLLEIINNVDKYILVRYTNVYLEMHIQNWLYENIYYHIICVLGISNGPGKWRHEKHNHI